VLAEETAIRDPEDPPPRRPAISIAPTGTVGVRSSASAREGEPPKGTSTRTKIFVVVGLILALGAVQGVRVIRSGSETTDNATVNARVVGISSEVAGTVREVLVREHERVEAGTVLMRLDTTTIDVRLTRARAELASAQVGFEQASMKAGVADKQVSAHVSVARGDELSASARARSIAAQTKEAEAAVQAAQAQVDQARVELASASKLHDTRSLASAQLEETRAKAAHAEAELRRAQASVIKTLAEQGVAEGARRAASGKVEFSLSGVDAKVAEAEARLAAARVDEAKALVDLAELERTRATVTAPFAGIIEKRRVEPGAYVTPGSEHFLLVATDKIWVEANFKESQLGQLAVGQTARVELDAFPQLVLDGRVERIGGATLSRTALLQVSGTGGGFARATQRVPVTIAIDRPPPVALPAGLNATVTVRVKKTP
jgi:membrane fusion protein (multidrug efflux system)